MLLLGRRLGLIAPNICSSSTSSTSSVLTRALQRPPGTRLCGMKLASSAGMAACAGKSTISGFVFDMDGTLTMSVIDFAEMRRRVGVPKGRDILDYITKELTPAEAEKAYGAIAEIEDQALRDMMVMPGAVELCKFLDAEGLPRGLITRNVGRSVDHFHRHHASAHGIQDFQPAINRDSQFAYKPSPEALLHICDSWGIPPSRSIMCGDSVKDDIVCGNRAGAVTILLDHEGLQGYKLDQFEGEMRPTHIVTSLLQVAQLLTDTYDLSPPLSVVHNHVAEKVDG